LDIAEDIKKVAEALTSARISDINRQRMVAERLERDCNGMFSRLKLDAARLSPDANQAYQECIVNTFFPDPHAVYDKNLDGGAALKRNNQRRALHVLRWVVFVFRTLSVVELLHGLEMHNCRRSKDFLWVNLSNLAENMFALERLTPSATTLKVRSTTGYGSTAGWALNLDDLSAKEFLARGQDELDFPYMGEDIPLNRSGDHGILHRCCFEYLFIPLVKEPSERFMRYCVEHWLDHFNQTTSESRSACVHLQRTLLIPGPEFHTFVLRTYAIPLKSKECGWTLPDADEITPLDVACRFGLLEISMELLEKCPTVPPRILPMAAFYGNEDALRLLLDREDVSANMCSDREIASPLYIAAYNGHHLIVESLLRREEADVNRCWSHGSTPLYIASERGDDKVVELLLQSPDILVNQPRDTDFSTPLHAAVGWGRGEIVHMLLNHKSINVNPFDSEWRTPLDIAIQEDRTEIKSAISSEGGLTVYDSMRLRGEALRGDFEPTPVRPQMPHTQELPSETSSEYHVLQGNRPFELSIPPPATSANNGRQRSWGVRVLGTPGAPAGTHGAWSSLYSGS
jgi:hypothetical protein